MLTIGEKTQKVGLYFHIPFCTKKCPYCHFYVVPNQARYHLLLFEGLIQEWENNLPLLEGKTIGSIYFGGGTPALFGPNFIGKLLDKIQKHASLCPECEITIEANPEDDRYLSEYRKLGVNRLSLGIQSLDERSLETLERTHSAKKAIEILFTAERAGFENVSIDLMYDLPGQTKASWQETLNKLPHLPFHHLSLYNLTIEPHTPFHKRRTSLPTAELSLHFLQTALEALTTMGLIRYEISAFSRPGFQAKHNKGYWMGRPFLGFGPSAFSYWNQERYRNQANLLRYHRNLKQNRSPVDFRERLEERAREKELFVIHLRLLEGAKPSSLLPKETLACIDRFIDQGFLRKNEDRIALTEKGTLFYDTIACDLI